LADSYLAVTALILQQQQQHLLSHRGLSLVKHKYIKVFRQYKKPLICISCVLPSMEPRFA
jgi:hypothetical protein